MWSGREELNLHVTNYPFNRLSGGGDTARKEKTMSHPTKHTDRSVLSIVQDGPDGPWVKKKSYSAKSARTLWMTFRREAARRGLLDDVPENGSVSLVEDGQVALVEDET